MNEIVFNAWGVQKKILRDPKRIIGAFAGKRCISPDSIVLCQDGVKLFADISDKDRVLSFDQRAKQFRLSQSSSAFPKTKEIGYRVVHDRGEFVASAHHQIFCADYKYRSVQEIASLLSRDSNAKEKTFLCPDHSMQELAQLLLPSSVQHLKKKLLYFLKNCENEFHRYGQQLLSFLNNDQALSLPLFDVQDIGPFVSFHGAFAPQHIQNHKRLKYNHHDLFFDQTSTQDGMGHAPFRSFDERLFQAASFFFQSLLCERQDVLQQGAVNQAFYRDLQFVSSCESNILAIERESKESWFWDIEVPGDNNYVANGAIHHNSGKTEVGAIRFIKGMEDKVNYRANGIDPFLGVVMAPTNDMLRRLSWKKFYAYAKAFLPRGFNKANHEAKWHDDSDVYGLSADNPARIEGIKANLIWLDEVFQMSEQTFLECRARISDSRGILICTGSLGVQFINPKQHWAYKYFKELPDENTSCYEWSTKDNPYFPQDELLSLQNQLDPQTFRAMFEINWDTIPKNAVYIDFNDDNVIKSYVYKDHWPTYVAIDWGYAHEMAVGFFQVDPSTGSVFLFDEIVQNRLTLEELSMKIKNKIQHYQVTDWCCDIAGNQEREQTGKSNVKWFKEQMRVHLKYKSDSIANGISLVRSYIKNAAGQRRFYILESCRKSIDGMKQYRYPEKDGVILNENPIKRDDDAVDMIRYFFINFIKQEKLRSTEIRTFR